MNINSTTTVPGFPNGLTLNQTVFPTGTPQIYTVPAGSGSPVVENCSDVTLSYQDQALIEGLRFRPESKIDQPQMDGHRRERQYENLYPGDRLLPADTY
ncbi:MAG: hypothetical protein IPJ82_05685 [Lewinellaceae bacterium]|nr:hypothetical protein [Lewinellaceae bacterium]